ncbi:SGNH/GDSL hydrolase family protein [Mucilaginibacter lacusdianchii]|uniref:SGNH/GDSL hydrolase family protein n=1 Tax=Mucilaginibacter lacusdianchii TaxID=2684211 RepID=UPI00131CC791|nr:SGNH/GDSL hydrolase family protein [Mucilaginibacter sp. JXJ CY 39]
MHWYEDEVKGLEKKRLQLATEPHTLFYGSSSIRLWTTLDEDFKELVPVNLGFGGSTLAACVWFFERIMAEYRPQQLIIYAGDNDLGDGRNPEEVFVFFQQLVTRVAQRFGNLPCYYVSLKPSPSRWNIAAQFKYTNQLIQNEIASHCSNWTFIDIFSAMLDASGKPKKELYDSDGLHLSKKGYQLWHDVINHSLQ